MAAEEILLCLNVLQRLHLGQQSAERRDVDVLVQARFDGREGQKQRGVGAVVADDLGSAAVRSAHPNGVNSVILNLLSLLMGEHLARLGQNLARERRNDILVGNLPLYTVLEGQLLIILIAADSGQVVTLVEEQRIKQGPCALLCRRLAGTLTLVYLDETVRAAAGGVLGKGRGKAVIIAQAIQYFRVGAVAYCAHKHGDVYLALTVNLDIEYVVGIGFVFKPCAAVGDYLRGIELFAHLVGGEGEVSTG